MRRSTLSTLLLPTLAACHATESDSPAHMGIVLTGLLPKETGSTVPASDTQAPLPTSIAVRPEHLALRQDPADPAVPNNNVNLGANPDVPGQPLVGPAGPNAPEQPPAAPAATSTSLDPSNPVSTILDSKGTAYVNTQGGESVTVMWLETLIDKTSTTWLPKTVTVSFAAVPEQGPSPGVGKIGLGTIAGGTGHTGTVVVGAAATRAVEWRGLVGAVGVGVLGMAV